MLGIAALVAESHMISGAGCVKKLEKTGSYSYTEREAGLRQLGFGLWLRCSVRRKNLALLLLLVHHNLGRSQSELKQLLSQPYRNASLPASSFMVC